MNSKEKILSALKASGAEEMPMPDLSGLEASAIKFPEPLEAFRKAVEAAGGRVSGAVPDDGADSFTVDGQFGVAENGAVWISGSSVESRRELFIHERLVILLDKEAIVNNMHEAYARTGETPDGYGIFISGPSKTADIEQALVFGAHGPREVIIVVKDI